MERFAQYVLLVQNLFGPLIRIRLRYSVFFSDSVINFGFVSGPEGSGVTSYKNLDIVWKKPEFLLRCKQLFYVVVLKVHKHCSTLWHLNRHIVKKTENHEIKLEDVLVPDFRTRSVFLQNGLAADMADNCLNLRDDM